MKDSQKLIKYLAIAFAFFLIITIISAISTAIYSLVVLFGIFDKNESNKNESNTEIKYNNKIDEDLENISSIDINVKYSNLIIKTADKLSVDTDNDDIEYNYDKNILEIVERKNKIFSSKKNKTLRVYIPSDIQLDSVKIDIGAGKTEIDSLNTNSFFLDTGAGKTVLRKVNANSASIDSGAGKLEIESSKFNNLDFDMGVGKTDITASLTGVSKIDAGVGELNLNLLESIDNYSFKINKGIGKITVNGLNTKDDEVVGAGKNIVNIDGGVGSISINTK